MNAHGTNINVCVYNGSIQLLLLLLFIYLFILFIIIIITMVLHVEEL